MLKLYNDSNPPASYIKALDKGGIKNALIAKILYGRGYTEPNEALSFSFDKTADFMHDFSLIKNITLVCQLIYDAVVAKKKIFIFGDYDVDGVTATAIMDLTLVDLGADVGVRLPDRLSEGYGISVAGIEDIYRQGGEVIITVDNGIRGHKEIEYAKSLGMQVIVLDHHIAGDTLPDADAIIDLHIPGETYPFVDLAGCGVAFKVSCALYEYFGYDYTNAFQYMDIAALGTVADVVPLVGENRIIVNEGLRLMNSLFYNREGVKALIDVFQLTPGNLVSTDIGFKLGPALNAPGRLLPRGAERSLDVFINSKNEDYLSLAQYLCKVNEDRKKMTTKYVDLGKKYIVDNNMQDDKVLVLFLPDVPEGIIGLVAGQVTEAEYKPSIVFTNAHTGFKASGRSVPEFDLYAGLLVCEDVLDRFGGHKQAAGMSVATEAQIIALRQRINQYADSVLTDEDMERKVHIDLSVNLSDFTMGFLDAIGFLEPFGAENPTPILEMKNFKAVKKNKDGWNHYSLMGPNKVHFKIFGENGISAVGFHMAKSYAEAGYPDFLNLLFNPGLNWFMGKPYIQAQVLEFEKICHEPIEMGSLAEEFKLMSQSL